MNLFTPNLLFKRQAFYSNALVAPLAKPLQQVAPGGTIIFGMLVHPVSWLPPILRRFVAFNAVGTFNFPKQKKSGTRM